MAMASDVIVLSWTDIMDHEIGTTRGAAIDGYGLILALYDWMTGCLSLTDWAVTFRNLLGLIDGRDCGREYCGVALTVPGDAVRSGHRVR